VHFRDNVIDVDVIVRMGVAGWMVGTMDFCSERQNPRDATALNVKYTSHVSSSFCSFTKV